MRSFSAAILFAIAATPAALLGQTASGTVAATATVQSAVAFQTPIRNLDLGVMTPGAAVTITPANGGEDLFAHFKEIQGTGFKTLKEGQRVEYVSKRGPKGMQASMIRPI